MYILVAIWSHVYWTSWKIRFCTVLVHFRKPETSPTLRKFRISSHWLHSLCLSLQHLYIYFLFVLIVIRSLCYFVEGLVGEQFFIHPCLQLWIFQEQFQYFQFINLSEIFQFVWGIQVEFTGIFSEGDLFFKDIHTIKKILLKLIIQMLHPTIFTSWRKTNRSFFLISIFRCLGFHGHKVRT